MCYSVRKVEYTDPGCLHGSLTVRKLGQLSVLDSLQALQKLLSRGALTINNLVPLGSLFYAQVFLFCFINKIYCFVFLFLKMTEKKNGENDVTLSVRDRPGFFKDSTLIECVSCYLLSGSDHDQSSCGNKNTPGCLFRNSIVASSRNPAFPFTAVHNS